MNFRLHRFEIIAFKYSWNQLEYCFIYLFVILRGLDNRYNPLLFHILSQDVIATTVYLKERHNLLNFSSQNIRWHR